MYITQTNPLKNEDYEGKGSISWFGILPFKIQKFALNNLAIFPYKSHKSTPWKTGNLVVKGLLAKAQKRAQKIKNSRGTNESGVHTYHTKHHVDHKREGTIGKAPTTNVK